MTMVERATPSQRLFHAAHVERQRRFGMAGQAQIYSPPTAPIEAPAVEVEFTPLPSFNRIAFIQKCVARSYGLRVNALTSHRKTSDRVLPRQIAMYLAKRLLGQSSSEIARRFGGRDRTTIRHAVQKIERLIATDPEIANQVSQLKAALEARNDS